MIANGNTVKQEGGIMDNFGTKSEGNRNVRRPEFKKIMADFATTTTFHGVKYIAESNHAVRRFMWIIVVLGCICATGWQIIDRILYFRGHPVNVNVNINYNQSLQFPALTICNQNVFKASEAEAYGHYRLIEDMFSHSESFSSRDLAQYGAENLTLDQLYMPLRHQKEDFIVKCEWNNGECFTRDFDVIATDHGICYTYKGNTSNRLISSSGVDSGLRLTLNVEQYEYMAGPHNAAGVKILLHDPKEFPSVHGLGQAIPTGSHAFVGVTFMLISNLPKPHGSCEDLSLPHTDHYSSEECYRDCMTRMAEDACGCRAMFMANIDGYPPVCTLDTYFGCFKDFMAKFHQTLKNQCNCPAPCTFSMFDPTLSYATISNQVVSKLLDSGEIKTLKENLLRGSEVTSRMDRPKFGEITAIIERLINHFNVVRAFVREISEQLSDYTSTAEGVFTDMDRVYGKKERLYRFQEYTLEKNFLRAREAMEERTLNNVALAFAEVAMLTRRRIERLVDMPSNRTSERLILLELVLDTLQTRKAIAILASENVSVLLNAYMNGTRIFNYKFEDIDRSHNDYIIPKPLLYYALTHNWYVRKYCPKLSRDLERYANVTDMFMELAMSAYENNTVNDTRLNYVFERFQFSCRTFMFSKSVCYSQGIELPIKVIRERLVDFNTIWNNFQTNKHEVEHNLQVLSDTVKIMESEALPKFDAMIQKAADYVKDNRSRLMDLAEDFLSPTSANLTRDLRDFFQDIRTRGQSIYDLWGLLLEPAVQMWTTIIEDQDTIEYYEYLNNTEFLRNVTEVQQEVVATYELIKTREDIRNNIENKDGDFFLSFEQLRSHLENFKNSITIDGNFVKENFLQVDVFYRQLSYEQINQQIAYDFFALICDIGGAMGLFIGASMLTVVEIIDFILTQTPIFGGKKTPPSKQDVYA